MALSGILGFAQGTRAEDITGLPETVGNALGIGESGGGWLLSIAILAAAGLSMSMISRGNNLMPTLIVLIGVIGLLIAIGWLDAWVLLLVGLLVAAMWGRNVRDWIAGAG